MIDGTWTPRFDSWRHGGYYVTNIRYPSGACGCVAKCDDGRWAIACPVGDAARAARFSTRTDAAHAERIMVAGLTP